MPGLLEAVSRIALEFPLGSVVTVNTSSSARNVIRTQLDGRVGQLVLVDLVLFVDQSRPVS